MPADGVQCKLLADATDRRRLRLVVSTLQRSTLKLSIADDQVPLGRDRYLTKMGPWGGSAAVHGALLLILLLWSIPIIQRGSLELTAFTGLNDQTDQEELTFALEETAAAHPAVEIETIVPPADFTVSEPELNESFETSFDPESADQPETLDASAVSSPAPGSQPTVGTGSVSDAESIEDAVDKITGGIRGRLAEGDLLVVWLLDSSLSLKDDRQRVAARLEDFLEDIEAESPQRDHQLLNAVVAFGQRVKERVSPTKSIDPVLHSIKTTPSDDSGIENVFSAVEKTTARYRSKWKSQMMIVIWTDESGDDVQRLNKTIAACNKGKVAVSVVGPSAVLGADTGFHAYTDPKTKLTFQLPVKRGPDSALPERIRLNYWFKGPPPRHVRMGRGRRSPFPPWYGGDNLAGITSGFSPHALTRLATSTGGSYTIFDRPEDRAPFDLDRMLEYIPAYGSPSDYQRNLGSHPLRKAVHEAVKITYATEIETPDLMFFGQPSIESPVGLSPLYFTATKFRSKLRSSRNRTERKANQYVQAIEKALANVSKDGELSVGMEYEYEHENAPRWKAWYDLTRGRLLANRVRIEEYRLTFENVTRKGALNDATNGLILLPMTDMLSTGEFLDYAEEAKRLLLRCLNQNPDTPWAYLAQRELKHGLGVEARQLVFQPVGQMKSTSAPKLPSF